MLNEVHNRSRRIRAHVRITGLILTMALLAISLHVLFGSPSLLQQMDVRSASFDLTHGKIAVTPVIAKNGRESFCSIVNRSNAIAAITGTYYGPEGKPLGDIVAGGKLVNRGYERQAIGFTRNGRIRFLERKGRGRIDWGNCYSGIACGPRLLRNGKKDINVRRDGFTSSATVIKACRCAVGGTSDGKLILCVVRKDVTLSVLADIMLKLGAKDAINMDGGSMCAFYESGNFHAEPARSMNNIVVVSAK